RALRRRTGPHLAGLAFGLRADQRGHIAFGVPVLRHQLVRFADPLEAEYAAEARVDLALNHEIVERVGLLVVREVRALEPLLAHPEVAEVDDRVVAAGARADHDHAAGIAHEDARRNGRLAGVLEHDRRRPLVAQRIPERFA